MTKLTTTMRSIALISILAIASVGTNVQASELSSQAKQKLYDALGQVMTSQVASIVTDINYDIEKSISQSLINLGLSEQPRNAKVTVTMLKSKE